MLWNKRVKLLILTLEFQSRPMVTSLQRLVNAHKNIEESKKGRKKFNVRKAGKEPRSGVTPPYDMIQLALILLISGDS